MIEEMPGFPAGTCGFRITGTITRDDYAERVLPRLRELVEQGDPLRALFVIEGPFHEQPSAAWEALKADVDYLVRHRHPWRVAVVTDQALVTTAIRLTSWLVPGEMRTFAMAEADDAREWIAAVEAPAVG